MKRNDEWDAVIAGAGPAGSVAAYVLACAGCRVLLADDSTRGRSQPAKPASRTIGESLPGIARSLLNDLGLPGILAQDFHRPCYGNVSSWGSDDLMETDFIRDPHGHGWHLDRAVFDRSIRAAAAQAGVTLRAARVNNATLRDHSWANDPLWNVGLRSCGRGAMDEDTMVQTQWLIDATGRRASLARGTLGIQRHYDTRLIALYRWANANSGDRRTLIESTPNGWWYTALLPGEIRVVSYHVDVEDAAGILRRSGVWEERLTRTHHISKMLEEARFLDNVQAMDASGARLNQFAGPGWLAVGDAALSFDPLSSQGIYTAIYTGMTAAYALLKNIENRELGLVDYSNRLEAIRLAYQNHIQLAYAAENRWSDAAFWKRRQTG